MQLSEFEQAKIHKVVGDYIESHRPPLNIREKLDLTYKLDGQSVVILEVRPSFSDPKKKIEEFVAKATYVKRSENWKIYWQRSDMKWHRYEPVPEVTRIDEFLVILEEDKHCCFWG